MRFKLFLENEIDPKLAYHDSLNPSIWTEGPENFELKPKIKEQLLKIAQEFTESLEIDNSVIQDYVITGSNANYNWTEQSDLDLHILIRPDALKTCENCKVDSESCLQAKKSLWNDRHDITIYGVPVEIYITAEAEKLVSDSGTYSLTSDRWVKLPEKKVISYDAEQVKAKSKELAAEIDNLISSQSDDQAQIKELLDKISRMRRAGLNREGEFSVENLTFKSLRNNGYIDKIRSYAVRAQDDKLSLE